MKRGFTCGVCKRSWTVEERLFPVHCCGRRYGLDGATAATQPPPQGPGTELAKILALVGASQTNGCTCQAMINEMNLRGPDGCRQHRAQIIEHLEKAYSGLTDIEKMRAAAASFTTGLAFSINWCDPIPSLVDLAIARAEASLGPP